MNDNVWTPGLRIVYARQPFPKVVSKTIFLAGPTPRTEGTGWRKDALRLLSIMGFDGHVFVPEPEDGKWAKNYDDQVEWEEEGLNRADCILFWIPRDMDGSKFFGYPMPGLTTNDEWGFWKNSGKVVFGHPTGADSVRYQEYFAKKLGIPSAWDLPGVVAQAIQQIGPGALRKDGECSVPLFLWNKPEFQAWYQSQLKAGNQLNDARISWVLRVPPPMFGQGPPKRVFLWALHVDMHISKEDRNKVNEVVLFRPDISSILLYDGASRIVLVKEFRSPVRNAEAMVYELPGGSSAKPGEDPLKVAAHEVEEETGLHLDPERFVRHDCRQLVATLSGHCSTLFSVRLTQAEMDKLAEDTEVHGVEADSERTYVEVVKVSRVLESQLLDWSTLGMVLSILRPIQFSPL